MACLIVHPETREVLSSTDFHYTSLAYNIMTQEEKKMSEERAFEKSGENFRQYRNDVVLSMKRSEISMLSDEEQIRCRKYQASQ